VLAAYADTVRRIATARNESWFRGSEGRWLVSQLNRRRSNGAVVDVFAPPSSTPESWSYTDATYAATTAGWFETLSSEPQLEASFIEAFRWWRDFRRPPEEAQRRVEESLTRIAGMAEVRREAWCLDEAGDWRVVTYQRRRDAGRTVDVFRPSSTVAEQWPVHMADALVEAGSWRKALAENVDRESEFIDVFKSWRLLRKPAEEEIAEQVRAAKEAIERLLASIPAFTLPQRHRLQLQLRGQVYKGIRPPTETQDLRPRRTARCWNCHRFLDNYAEFECLACGWILCKCGACGCGKLQHISSCPMCGCRFTAAERLTSAPYCGWTCKSLALEDYGEYLKSEEWAQRRSLALVRDGYKCQDCQEPATQVHHTTYERVGAERLEDLVSLCQRCHRIRHIDASGTTAVGTVLATLKR